MNSNIWQELISTARNARRFIKWLLMILLLLVLGIYFRTGFYSIEPDQIGILQILGKVVDKRVMPGPHYALPWPLSRVYKIPVKEARSLIIDDFFQDGDSKSRSSIFYQLTGLESYCLSGDNNAVQIKMVIQYVIKDPFNYIFGSSEKETLLRDIVCREAISVLADRTVDNILTIGKREIKNLVQKGAQEKLDADRTGLSISSVDIREIQPPSSVQTYFDDVINAQVDKEKIISRAESYYNEEIPAARGESDRLIKKAQAYRNQAINAALGESERFEKKLAEYRKSPEITRKRLYLEFVRQTLDQINNLYLLDAKEGKAPARLRLISFE